jgi:hypothetical protein
MDLNTMINREGEERLRADHAASGAARDAHLAIAGIFRDRIDFRRRTLHAEAGPVPRRSAR